MKQIMKSLLNRLPYVNDLYRQTQDFKKNSSYPAGHYYSPIASVEDIRQREGQIWKGLSMDGIEGLDLNSRGQVELVKALSTYYKELPFARTKGNEQRYYFENNYYSYTDGIVLYSIMRHFKPSRIIEVGSGYSSALMMDVNDLFFDGKIDLTFIEPYPERLFSLMSQNDKESATVIEKPVQNVALDDFRKLQKGDILFIDSSHVSKCGSDVNFIIFHILPVLNPGVLIHFHDIFYPFEYPKEWIYNGWSWNEDYLLKAFLLYNEKFSIRLFAHYLHLFHKEAFSDMPLTYSNTGGNIWIEKKSADGN